MFRTIAVIAVLLAVSFPAAPKDAVKAAVTPLLPTTPIVTMNGNPYSTGTYGVGTIQLLYTVTAYNFTAGPFAQFSLSMATAPYQGNQTSTYPVLLNLIQTGSSNLTLTPVPESFSIPGTAWEESAIVTVSIPSHVAANPSLNADGTDLVANLQMATEPNGAHVDTPTTVQVHIRLIHPTSCLRFYDFITDKEFTTIVNSIDVNVNKNTAKVTSTSPGQFSDNILVVNSCGTPQPFDLKILLDGSFETNPSGNPGNAVFTYTTGGAVTPDTFNIAAFGTGAGRGQQLCLSNLTVAAGQTFLATVHMGIIKGMAASLLPADSTMDFAAELRTAGSNCGGTLLSFPIPNPAGAILSFVKK